MINNRLGQEHNLGNTKAAQSCVRRLVCPTPLRGDVDIRAMVAVVEFNRHVLQYLK